MSELRVDQLCLENMENQGVARLRDLKELENKLDR